MSGASLNSKILWALSPEAKLAFQKLVAAGCDEDLAFCLLETVMPERELYALNDDEPADE